LKKRGVMLSFGGEDVVDVSAGMGLAMMGGM
jgi:hypothetical protein